MPLPGPRHLKRAALLLTATALTAALLPAGVAAAATHPVGHMDPAKQAANGIVSVQGWAFDRGSTTPSVQVDVNVDAHFMGRPTANRPRAGVNTKYHVSGNHGLSWTIAVKHRAHIVTVWARPVVHGEVRTLIGTLYLNGYRPPAPAGTRIIAEARKFVGKDPYVEGGTSPTRGFDCSGYTQYVYRVTKVASLPRTAEQQRHAVRIIPRTQARPGDLVFYLSGGIAYHIAIYAGGNKQYAAATPKDGIVYQSVWSSAVQYGTTWH